MRRPRTMTPTVIDGCPDDASAPARRPPRIPLIDWLRGFALVAMAVYHFTWDLGYFGYIDPSTATTGGWRFFARMIASSFLFLAGFSLVLAHARGLRPKPFMIRLARILAAALVITAGTWFAFPDTFIFFGILHAIAAASVIGLIFLRLPVAAILVAAVAVTAAPLYLRAPVFDHPALWWVGLSLHIPRSNDYVPLLPWLAPFLAGMAACRLLLAGKLAEQLAAIGTGVHSRWITLLEKAGRHSLAIYLVHQPVLIALLYGISLVAPAPAVDLATAYRSSCIDACEVEREETFCRSFCPCTLERLIEQNLFSDLMRNAIDVAQDDRIAEISSQCTMATESGSAAKE